MYSEVGVFGTTDMGGKVISRKKRRVIMCWRTPVLETWLKDVVLQVDVAGTPDSHITGE